MKLDFVTFLSSKLVLPVIKAFSKILLQQNRSFHFTDVYVENLAKN